MLCFFKETSYNVVSLVSKRTSVTTKQAHQNQLCSAMCGHIPNQNEGIVFTMSLTRMLYGGGGWKQAK